jgi:hypothetical protein
VEASDRCEATLTVSRASDEAKFNAAAFNLLLAQVVFASGAIGYHFGSWCWFGGVFVALAALVSMPRIRLFGALGLAAAGSVAVALIASRYFSTAVFVIIGIAAFALFGTLNAAAAKHQDDLDAVDTSRNRTKPAVDQRTER